MSKLMWGAVGERFFEAGVDRGVLYVDGSSINLVNVPIKNPDLETYQTKPAAGRWTPTDWSSPWGSSDWVPVTGAESIDGDVSWKSDVVTPGGAATLQSAAATSADYFPCKPGDVIEASAVISLDAEITGDLAVEVDFYDNTNTYINYPDVAYYGPGSIGTHTYKGTQTAPPGAVSFIIEVYVFHPNVPVRMTVGKISMTRHNPVMGQFGVPWNGLVSVSEEPDGGEATPYYIDGVKYLNQPASEEFQATLEAYTYPDEFAKCDGTKSVRNGLFATQQHRKGFGLAYRTRVGNDIDGTDHGYKIHLVYDALAAPTSSSFGTISDSVSPDNFSWKITTKPSAVSGFKRTSHFVIDSRETPSTVMTRIEEILYGSDSEPARLPTVRELVYVFEAYTASNFDAGVLGDPYYATFDAGLIATVPSSTIDGGAP